MASWRCSSCGTQWPLLSEYDTCPDCLIDTWYSPSSVSLSTEEAKVRKAHIEFRRYYEVWQKARHGDTHAITFLRQAGVKELPTGPSPEVLGYQDARAIIDLEASLDLDMPEREAVA